MSTPTQWLNTFQVNTGDAEIGEQSAPKIVGLANGSFVVAWEEAEDGLIGTTRGSDIIAKIYDAEGNVVRDAFRLNQIWSKDDEVDFDLTATHDGFAFAAIDDDLDNGARSGVIYERFDFLGNRPEEITRVFPIVDEDTFARNIVGVDLAANLTAQDDRVFVTYVEQELSRGSSRWFVDDIDVRGRVIDGTGKAGAIFDIASREDRNEWISDAIVLANGNFVSVHNRADGDQRDVQFALRNPEGQSVGQGDVVLNNTSRNGDAAALRDGGFAIVSNPFREFDLHFYNADGSLKNTTSFDTRVLAPLAVGLPDGGLVVLYLQRDGPDTRQARVFDKDGVQIGDPFDVGDFSSFAFFMDVSVTGDGRILFTWIQEGEVVASIWDPRSTTIDPGDYAEETAHFLSSNVITTGVNGSTVLAGSKGDRVLGQDGNDTIISSGSGHYFGGGGNDYIQAGRNTLPDDFERLDGGDGTDTLDLTQVAQDYRVDLTSGFAFESGSNGAERFTNFENVILGSGANVVTGTDDRNVIDTGAGADIIHARGGNDLVRSGAGNDEMRGQDGADELRGGAGMDSLFGGSGNDRILGEDGGDALYGGLGEDRIDGGKGDDVIDGGAGSDQLVGGAGNDILRGRSGDDELSGYAGDDTINGGNGDDIISRLRRMVIQLSPA